MSGSGRLLFWQMMLHLRGSRSPSGWFLCSFSRNDPEVSQYHGVNHKTLETTLSCVCCWQMQSEICGTHWRFNSAEFMVSVCAVNKPVYPEPNLSMSRSNNEKKVYLFSDRHSLLKGNEILLFLSAYFYGLQWVSVSQLFLYSTVAALKKKLCITLKKLWYPACI